MNWQRGLDGIVYPSLHPSPIEDKVNMDLPEDIRIVHNRLTQITQMKYNKEFLKICAFYNKMFPSLYHNQDFGLTSHNTVPFTIQNRERTDTGMGIQTNYLKSIVDTIVSRLGNMQFDFKLLADQPTLLYAIYKDEIERVFKAVTRKFKLVKLAREVFHDAAIIGFSHMFCDPWSEELRKISDWEAGFFESEFAQGKIKQLMVRDCAFPVTSLGPYVKNFDEAKLLEVIGEKTSVDLRLFCDCITKKRYVTIGGYTDEGEDYPFNTVQMVTFSWDVGVKAPAITSLFDLLYPVQRAIDKLMAKKSELLARYKGPVPIFSRDAELVVKNMGNGAGEALFLNTAVAVDPSELCTVIEMTPLDEKLQAEAEALKAQMHELAGIQQISMDLENYRSAAAVIALDQQRDSAMQSQVAALAEFVKDMMECYAHFCAKTKSKMFGGEMSDVSWKDVDQLLQEAHLEVKPIQSLDQTGGVDEPAADPDYSMMNISKFIFRVIKGEATLDDLDYTLDYDGVKAIAALKLMRLKAIIDTKKSTELLRNLEHFLVQCFVEDLRMGTQDLGVGGGEEAPPEGDPAAVEAA